jgi:signal transduction histidine kinase
VGEADVWLSASDGGVHVEVTDRGTGFAPELSDGGRFGLREVVVGRLRAVGGTARVQSAPHAGAVVMLEWR